MYTSDFTETEHVFMANTADWDFATLVPLSDLHCLDNGYLVNDVCIVEVEASVPTGFRNLEDQETGDLMNFKGLGRIEKTFVPILEEVCSSYPSLIDGQMKRSRTFVQCAFTALGRVLHFLKTTTANDMNVDACQHLQLLWEELEAFKFDLAWLEPHVQSVFAMKKKAGIVNRLQEDVDALKNEIERRRAILAEAEAVLEVAERDLAEAQEEHFSKIDMDSELGYPLS
ncbi:MATH domain and coiled-coil domain-containing protein At3g58250-like [Malus sylvestris]|uniref:MATH domain and coiled-coil domain-containing protein At3g58250-like n=1 Tax=Malus sylvestris TaxID=3752 RepID=UPI0021AC7857|nr:MATH domain and coiled-coil domain-containing protein At3g58250-like [Malus sylvestris]